MTIRSSAAVLVVVATVGCGDTTAHATISLAELAGDWDATEISVTSDPDPSLTEDLYALGVRWRMTVETDGRFAVTLSNPFGSDGYSGTLTIEGDSLVLLRSSADSPSEPPLRETIHYLRVADALQLS